MVYYHHDIYKVKGTIMQISLATPVMIAQKGRREEEEEAVCSLGFRIPLLLLLAIYVYIQYMRDQSPRGGKEAF